MSRPALELLSWPKTATMISPGTFPGGKSAWFSSEALSGDGIWRHSRRVADYTLLLARALAIQETEFLRSLEQGALFHDIGKIGLPPHILLKRESLSGQERKAVEEHPLRGFRLISQVGFWPEAWRVVLFHHERYDGQGYPFGLAKDAIPLSAKILAVADALEAMTSDRPYRRGRSFQAAAREICRCRGGQFDPEIVEAFLTVPPHVWLRIWQKAATVLRPSVSC
jgi:HD-GYP domain-containing protein (c-di-GMP phosphodiesterase class II)